MSCCLVHKECCPKGQRSDSLVCDVPELEQILDGRAEQVGIAAVQLDLELIDSIL